MSLNTIPIITILTIIITMMTIIIVIIIIITKSIQRSHRVLFVTKKR